ncbi:hypothetical protein F1559_004924 [Cyanidiococcus yangmingshanensis]|uniref:TAFII55 protein conserved region domain-containing protein n=1 Tax=Cyanidiococcus yangmingshanensis TaxID=2690220 RepID=A0A7J7IRS6_9RHOD|nr:hypothetical protein F1559_004924 [Cyanidiococcus yangmingshanensis]
MNAPQESHFILRLPEHLAKRLRKALASSEADQEGASSYSVPGRAATSLENGKVVGQERKDTGSGTDGQTTTGAPTQHLLAATETERFWLVFFPENRNGRLAALRIGNEDAYEEHFGFLFDLPCITETWKTLDGRTMYKCADTHQILQIYDDPKDLPSGVDVCLPDGLTPASRGFSQRHRPEEPKYSAVEVAQHEEIIKYALDFRKPWNGPKPVSVDVDEEVIEEEVWVPVSRDDAQASTAAQVPMETIPAVEPDKKLDTRDAKETQAPLAGDTDQFASDLEQALLLGSEGVYEEPPSSSPEPQPTKIEAAVRQAEQARKEVVRRNLELRIAELEHEVKRIANPLLRSRVQRRLDQTKEELNQLNSAE